MQLKQLKGWQIGAIIGFVLGVIIYILTYPPWKGHFSLLVLLIISLYFATLFSLVGFLIGTLRNWKESAYWKKGAVIGMIVNPVLVVSSLIFSSTNGVFGDFFMYFIMIAFFLPFHIAEPLHSCSGEGCTGYVLLSYMWISLFGFIMGALIALIIKKRSIRKK